MSQPGIATVRLLADVTADDLSDTQISDLLALHDGGVKSAAAEALEIVAARLQSVTSDDISIDGNKRAQVLLRRAETLRAQADADQADDGFAFDVIDTAWPRPELTPYETGGWC